MVQQEMPLSCCWRRLRPTNPMKLFVDDAKDCVALAGERFPSAKVFLLGHSQGTYIALQVAHQMPAVKGVALPQARTIA
jgi:alpha-beta hydrolase superfamily lysophospholipase